MGTKKGLGKGLAALIQSGEIDSTGYKKNFSIKMIQPNPYQPRMNIDPEDLIELADSIREHGIIQPLIITKNKQSDNQYFLVAGERRLKAAQLANLSTVPVVIQELSPQKMLEIALIENIQRQDLNALEEGVAFKQLQTEFGLTHTEIAKKVALSRTAVTNKIRLLKLPDIVKEHILNGDMSEGHARALLGLENETSLIATANIVVKRHLSVRETEHLVRRINYSRKHGKQQITKLNRQDEELAKKLSEKFGLQIRIQKSAKGGKVVIFFKSKEELEKLMTDFTSV